MIIALEYFLLGAIPTLIGMAVGWWLRGQSNTQLLITNGDGNLSIQSGSSSNFYGKAGADRCKYCGSAQ